MQQLQTAAASCPNRCCRARVEPHEQLDDVIARYSLNSLQHGLKFGASFFHNLLTLGSQTASFLAAPEAASGYQQITTPRQFYKAAHIHCIASATTRAAGRPTTAAARTQQTLGRLRPVGERTSDACSHSSVRSMAFICAAVMRGSPTNAADSDSNSSAMR